MSVPFRTEHVALVRPSVLDVAVQVFAADASASLADVAHAAGIGRTTLHKRYPRRQDLLVAIAQHSLDALEAAIAAALGGTSESGPDGALDRDPTETLRLLVEKFVPLGAHLSFLMRQPSLDAVQELNDRWNRLDEPIKDVVRDAQRRGAIRGDVPVYWVVTSLYGLVYAAWEGVAVGELARAEAPALALDGLLNGVRDVSPQK